MTVKLGWDRERRSNPEFFPTSVSEDKDLLRLTMFYERLRGPKRSGKDKQRENCNDHCGGCSLNKAQRVGAAKTCDHDHNTGNRTHRATKT